MHNLTWAEIIGQAHSNPHFFDTCLENGCTHSVELNIQGPLAGKDYNGKQSGDGASALRGSINMDYLKWNPSHTTAGGWEASKIRNTLNGTPTTNGFLSESDALISAFPKELQTAIKAKKVVSGTALERSGDNLSTTYDKLWLFSSFEMYKSGGYKYNIDYIDQNEGKLYCSQDKMNATGYANYCAAPGFCL